MAQMGGAVVGFLLEVCSNALATCSDSRLLTRHNQENAQWSPDSFLCERVGSGHKTNRWKNMILCGLVVI